MEERPRTVMLSLRSIWLRDSRPDTSLRSGWTPVAASIPQIALPDQLEPLANHDLRRQRRLVNVERQRRAVRTQQQRIGVVDVDLRRQHRGTDRDQRLLGLLG